MLEIDSCSSPIVFPRGAACAPASGLCSGSRHRLVEAGVEPHPELVEGIGFSASVTGAEGDDDIGDAEVAGGAAAAGSLWPSLFDLC